MISAIFIILAAVCNAIMDRVENENFYVSVFKNLNPKFWYKRESWEYAKKLFGYKFDAWHLAKSGVIIFMCTAMVLYKPVFNGWVDFILAGILWNLVFNLFYNHIFKRV